jgi:hypothetical protein
MVRGGLMGDIYDLMVSDARQSFFQLENLMSSLDTKAFGVVAIGAVIFSIYTYIINSILKDDILYLPYLTLVLSLLVMICCIFPRNWKRGSSLKNIQEHGNMVFEDAANTMAMNYSKWEDKLYKTYKSKVALFEIGLGLMGISILFEIVIIFGFLIPGL